MDNFPVEAYISDCDFKTPEYEMITTTSTGAVEQWTAASGLRLMEYIMSMYPQNYSIESYSQNGYQYYEVYDDAGNKIETHSRKLTQTSIFDLH